MPYTDHKLNSLSEKTHLCTCIYMDSLPQNPTQSLILQVQKVLFQTTIALSRKRCQVCTKDTVPNGEHKAIVGFHFDMVNIVRYCTSKYTRNQSVW